MAEAASSIAVVGAGGHARVVAEALALCGTPAAGYLAPAPSGAESLGTYLGDDRAIPELADRGYRFALGTGFVDAAGGTRRAALIALLRGMSLVTIRHPSAIVSPSAELGAGAFIAAGAVVGTRAVIGAGAIINTGALVDHDSRIGAGTHVATGARIAGGVTVGGTCLVGLGAALRQGITLGDHVVVGAGAVVVSDIASGETALGVPARVRKDLS